MHKLKRAYYRICRDLTVSSTSYIEGFPSELRNSNLYFTNESFVHFGKDTAIKNCRIKLDSARLILEDGVRLNGIIIEAFSSAVVIGRNTLIDAYCISCGNGSSIIIGDCCVLEQGDNWRKPLMEINGCLRVSHHNRLRSDVKVRFDGNCEIGEYNCINERTEIRCDERIDIGSFNMISYNCRIWDTNTHSFYEDDTRRRMTIRQYPNIGAEKDKPTTKPVQIGDDCLFGEGSVVLKGSVVGNKCIIGTRSVLAGKTMPGGTTAVGNPVVIVNDKLNV